MTVNRSSCPRVSRKEVSFVDGGQRLTLCGSAAWACANERAPDACPGVTFCPGRRWNSPPAIMLIFGGQCAGSPRGGVGFSGFPGGERRDGPRLTLVDHHLLVKFSSMPLFARNPVKVDMAENESYVFLWYA